MNKSKLFFLLLVVAKFNYLVAQLGSLDESFNTGSGTLCCQSHYVNAICLQPDNKIIVGGTFPSFNGVLSESLLRLNSDGSIDPNFNANELSGISNLIINSLAIQNDGKIIIGFSTTDSNHLLRLNSNGNIDSTFNFGQSGVNGNIYCVKVQDDQKILIGGDFTSYNGILRTGIIRLNSDGSPDIDFNQGVGIEYPSFVPRVFDIEILPDNSIVVVGDFTSFNGFQKNRFVRLFGNGSLDNQFNSGSGANAQIRSIQRQSDGKLIIGGSFTHIDGVLQHSIARLEETGIVDNSFNVASSIGSSFLVKSVAIQSNGNVLAGGLFNQFAGETRNYLVCINPDGTLNTEFSQLEGVGVCAGCEVKTIVVQDDQKVLIGGDFMNYNSVAVSDIARIKNTLDDAGLTLKNLISGRTNVYPNPTQGKITISFDKKINKDIIISDIYGNIISNKEYTSDNIEIFLDGNSGVYFLTIDSIDGILDRFKLIKN